MRHKCGRESKVTYGDENDTYILSISEIFIDLYMFLNLSNTTQISILLLVGFIEGQINIYFHIADMLQIVRVLTVFLIPLIFIYYQLAFVPCLFIATIPK